MHDATPLEVKQSLKKKTHGDPYIIFFVCCAIGQNSFFSLTHDVFIVLFFF